MVQHTPIREAELARLVPVLSLDELDWLVKESELMTGERGREFVVAGADRPAFHVQVDPSGYEIRRTDGGTGSTSLHATAPELLLNHTLGNALACGLLFTAALH